MQMSCSEFVTCMTWDSVVNGLIHHHNLEHLLVGRWAWEMCIGIKPCFCTLDTFHGFLSSPRVFGHQHRGGHGLGRARKFPGWAIGPWAEILKKRKINSMNYSPKFRCFFRTTAICLMISFRPFCNKYKVFLYFPIWARFCSNGPAHGLGWAGLGFFNLSPAHPRPKKSGPCPFLHQQIIRWMEWNSHFC